MTTILIWLGSGFAFAVGVVAGAAMFGGKKAIQSEQHRQAEESIAELRRRNEIGLRQAEALERIADSVGRMVV